MRNARATDQLRLELEWLRARYDSAQVSLAVYAVVKALETDISWRDHKRMSATREDGAHWDGRTARSSQPSNTKSH